MELKKFVWAALSLTVLAFIQNVSFSIVSRSRNRSSYRYHLIASIFSNSIWFLTMKQLVAANLNLTLIPFYIAGTVAGSLYGVSLSMKIECWLKATSDDHIQKKNPEMEEIKSRIKKLEEMFPPEQPLAARVYEKN